MSAAPLRRREVLKLGAGFSLAAALAAALPGCRSALPGSGHVFLLPADVELFTALAPVVVTDLATLAAGERELRLRQTLANIDGACAGLDWVNRGELRKLLDLLAIAPLRYLLAGVGDWARASPDELAGFLKRWRASRFETLNAGGIVLVKLIAASYFVIPASFAAAGYPGPFAPLYRAANG